MRAIIIDDEPLARAYLRRLLEREGVDVVEEADEASRGIALAEELCPDVVFLDIRMPGMGGMEATRRLSELEPGPLVVLVTAYSEYALDAFQKSALDYLVKPVSADRLSIALTKARKQLALHRKAKRAEGLARNGRPNHLQRLPIRVRGSIRLLPMEKIVYAMASEKNVVIKARDAEYRTSYTLANLEEILPTNFMRIHASCIVNLAAIEEILVHGNHRYEIRLLSGEELPFARQHYSRLHERLGFPSAA